MVVQTRTSPTLETTDPAVAELIEGEIARQSETICLIPSENYVSRAVLAALGSVFTNKCALTRVLLSAWDRCCRSPLSECYLARQARARRASGSVGSGRSTTTIVSSLRAARS